MTPEGKVATLACGCFWCTEAIFKQIKGVAKVEVGYSGGKAQNPSYEEVSRGSTGHAEALQISFDPQIISYKDILYIFFHTHNPTTPNRQGADEGPQYRSVIFYHDEEQKTIAEMQKEEAQKSYKDRVITEIVPFESFFKAEQYHKDYYAKNPNAMYCRLVIDPKIQKLKKGFGEYLK